MSNEIAVHKFTLSTNKTVELRDPEVYHLELAAQIAGKKAKDNQLHSQVLVQKETLRLLIVKIDGKALDPIAKERLFAKGDKTLSLKEYSQCMQAVQMITGGEDLGKPIMEIMVGTNSGDNTHGAPDTPA